MINNWARLWMDLGDIQDQLAALPDSRDWRSVIDDVLVALPADALIDLIDATADEGAWEIMRERLESIALEALLNEAQRNQGAFPWTRDQVLRFGQMYGEIPEDSNVE